MSRECPRCRLTFPRRYARKLVWCPTDRGYFCSSCFQDHCLPTHGQRALAWKVYRQIGEVGLIFFGTVLAPFAIAAIFTSTPEGQNISNTAMGEAILLVLAVGVGWFAVTAALRATMHARTVRGLPPADLQSTSQAREPNLPWRDNHAAPPRRARTSWALAGLLGGLAGVVLLVWVLLGFPADFLIVVAVGGGFLLAGASMAAWFASLPVAVPSAIAVTSDGIHFWYDSALDRRTQTSVMKWTTLNILGMRSQMGGDPGPRLVRWLRIDPDNAREILEAWQSHKIARSTPPPYVPSALPALAASPPAVPRSRAEVRASAARILQPRSGAPHTPGHGVACARCHVVFPRLEAMRLLWCKVDRFYVCRRCWEDGCHGGHGRGTKAVSKSSRIATAIVTIVVLLGLWYPAFAYDYTLTNAWASAPVTALSRVQSGQVVKVQGTIESNAQVAFGGHEILQGGDWNWEWDTGDVFTLVDSSGSITVSSADWYIVYDGPEAAPNAVHLQVGVYGPANFVQIVGTVVRAASGALVLDLQVMALAVAVPLITLGPSALSTAMTGLLPLAILVTVGAGATIFLNRRRIHRAATQGHPRHTLAASSEPRDSRLNWVANGKGTNPQRRAIGAAIFILAGVALLGLYPGFRPRIWFGYFSLGFVGSVVLMFEVAVVYMYLFGGVGHPSFVAVADDGFHMWFESPYDQHLSDTVFPWDHIQDIHMTSGKGAHWVLRWTTGEATNLYMLNGTNLHLLLEGWTSRKMPAAV